tara:strand:+ start:752 stop:883 length:132 start_codon:yes stop_codon:yes gene_type:complete
MKAYQLFLLFLLALFTQPSLSKAIDINILVEDGYFPIVIDAQT